MDIFQATECFDALSQETRLKVFRLLVKAGRFGLTAGEIAHELDVKQNTMSTNLSVLTQAGILSNQRDGRYIYYSVNFNRVSELLSYILQDCCGGNPDECQPIINNLSCMKAS